MEEEDKENCVPAKFQLMYTPMKNRNANQPRSPFLDITPNNKKKNSTNRKSSGRRKLLGPNEFHGDTSSIKKIRKFR